MPDFSRLLDAGGCEGSGARPLLDYTSIKVQDLALFSCYYHFYSSQYSGLDDLLGTIRSCSHSR